MADPLAPHVLVVDDDPDARAVVAKVIAAWGWRATPLAEPPAAAEVAALGADAVLLDYWFGREPLAVPFLEALRAEPATARVPVVLATATLAAELERPRWAGLADELLAKPFGLDQLRAALEGSLGARGGSA